MVLRWISFHKRPASAWQKSGSTVGNASCIELM